MGKLWIHAHGPRRSFSRGLIQIAADCHKAYERGDRRGCAVLVAVGFEKICRHGLPGSPDSPIRSTGSSGSGG